MIEVDIRVVLCLAAIFVVGGTWMCDDCGAGGFVAFCDPNSILPRDHRAGCGFARMP